MRIRDEAAGRWRDLAAQLNFKRGVIKIIEGDSDGCEDAFDDLVSRWLDGAGRQPVVWRTLLSALNDIELHVLAQDVQQILETHTS